MSRAYKSDIAEFFTIKYDEFGRRISGKCKLCPNLVIKSATPPNYWHHLENIHQVKPPKVKSHNNNSNNNDNNIEKLNIMDICNENEANNDEINEEIEESTVISRKRVKISENIQQTLQFPSVSVSKLQKFHNLFSETLAKMGFPHELVENDEFRQLFIEFSQLKCSENMKFINIKQHKKQIMAIASSKFNEILEILQNNNNLITLAIDGWTGHAYGAKNTNIIALCNGKSYLLWSDRNSDEKDSTDAYLFPLIHEKIKFLWSKSIAICAITTDNATNMLNVGRELYNLPIWLPNKSVILHISCSAHTIQLMLQDIINLEPIATVIRDVLAILDPFTTVNGKKLRTDLRKQQVLDGKTPLKLVYSIKLVGYRDLQRLPV